MTGSNIAARNPEFGSLTQALTVDNERFRLIEHLKAKQEIYHGIHDLQEQVVRMPREERRR